MMFACEKDSATLSLTEDSLEPPGVLPILEISEERTIGDSLTSYLNPEFSDDGKYMIWLEQTLVLPDEDVIANVWHCEIDPATGEMIPEDGRGFFAYKSSIYKRPNMGFDSQGAYYAGADRAGNLVIVRPSDAFNGTVMTLATPAEPNRRGIFPSVMPNSDKQYIYWFNPDVYPFPADAATISVEYIDVADPTNIHLVETQTNSNPGSSWTAMDLAVPRWIDGLPEFTFGFGNAPVERVQVKLVTIDVDGTDGIDGTFTKRVITNHPRNHFDPSPYFFEGARYIMPGDGENSVVIYKELNNQFRVQKSFTVDNSNSSLIEPCSVLSNEAFVLNGNYFSIFLTSDCSESNGAFLNTNGEVFLIGVESSIDVFQAISKEETGFVKNEPEVTVTSNSTAFVYYNAFPKEQNPLTATYQLRMIPITLTDQ